MTDKTHWRKFFDSPYLSSADIVDPITVTIDHANGEKDKVRGREELIVIHFKEKEIRKSEKLKPMVVNVTNSKTITKLAGSPYLDNWAGVRLQIYVDHDVRFGKDIVEGLRVQEPPRSITQAQAAAIRDKLAALEGDEGAFCKYMKVEALEDIPATQLGKAQSALKAKEKAAKK